MLDYSAETLHEGLRIESKWHGIDFVNYLCSEYIMMGSWSYLPPSLEQVRVEYNCYRVKADRELSTYGIETIYQTVRNEHDRKI